MLINNLKFMYIFYNLEVNIQFSVVVLITKCYVYTFYIKISDFLISFLLFSEFFFLMLANFLRSEETAQLIKCMPYEQRT